MKTLYRMLRPFMRGLESRMISRLLRQRDDAWAETDRYKRAMGLHIGAELQEEAER